MVVVLDFFFFNDTATTEIYTLSLHDALPISVHGVPHDLAELRRPGLRGGDGARQGRAGASGAAHPQHPRGAAPRRSEEHTSELQSRQYLVCRLLLEKKKK